MLNLLYRNKIYTEIILLYVLLSLSVFAIHIIMVVCGTRMARRRNKDAGAWGLLTFLCGLLAIIVLACSSSQANTPTNTSEKISDWVCPSCGKMNSGFYKKCHLCGTANVRTDVLTKKSSKSPERKNNAHIITNASLHNNSNTSETDSKIVKTNVPSNSSSDAPEWKCSTCGKKNSAFYKKCSACGAERKSIKTSFFTKPTSHRKEWKCSACGKMNSSFYKMCYSCGAERKAIQPSTNTKKTAIAWKCAKCGELNNPNAKNCINCFTEKPNS